MDRNLNETARNPLDSLDDVVERMVHVIAGRGASGCARRKARIFIGVAGLIAANVWLGALIGHGVAALLGAGFYFLVALRGEDGEC